MTQTYNETNKTAIYFCKASRFLVICGLPGYIKWQENGFTKPIYKYVNNFLMISVFIFIAMELGAFVTQGNLSEKRKKDLIILCFSHPILLSYHFVIQYHKERLKELIFKLCVILKNAYNDPVVERVMIKKATVYSVLFSMNVGSALILYGFDGLLEVLYSDGTFITVITAWPDVDDRSTLAYIGRVISYFVWWVWMSRVTGAFLIIIITTVCLSHQYTNLQSYFYSLNDIFDVEDENETNIDNAELKYEEAVKIGIKLHAETLWCTRQCQTVCGIVYSAHVIVQVSVLSMLMLQMVNSERTLTNAVVIVATSISLLASTGILMWNAGDVTIEAARVATAMYSSGWQNCRGDRSQRIRKLLSVAITQAQRKVVIRSFGVMEMSYQAYVTIVKSSYSAFSLLY